MSRFSSPVVRTLEKSCLFTIAATSVHCLTSRYHFPIFQSRLTFGPRGDCDCVVTESTTGTRVDKGRPDNAWTGSPSVASGRRLTRESRPPVTCLKRSPISSPNRLAAASIQVMAPETDLQNKSFSNLEGVKLGLKPRYQGKRDWKKAFQSPRHGHLPDNSCRKRRSNMIVHFISRRDSLLSGSILFCILVSILAVISFVTFPDIVDASGPGGHSPGGIRPPSGGGGHRGGGGFGFGIGIQLAPRIDPAAQEPNWDKIEKDMKGAAPATTTDGGTTKTRAVAKEPAYVAPARKLTKPRVPYLTELAIDIDKTLMDLAWNEPVKAIQLYKSALAQAKKKGDVQGEREALTNLAHVYYLTGRFARAAETYEEAFAISRKLKDMTEEAAARRNLAAVFIAWGQYDQAENRMWKR